MTNSSDDLDYITEQHIRTIGFIIVGWNMLERLIEISISALMKPPHWVLAEIVSAQLSYPQKRNLLSGLAEISFHGTEHQKQFASLLIEIDRLNGVRDMVAHGRWVKGRKPNTIKPWRIKAKGKVALVGLKHNEPEYSPDDLKKEFWAIGAAMTRLHQLMQDTGLAQAHDEMIRMTSSFATMSAASDTNK